MIDTKSRRNHYNTSNADQGTSLIECLLTECSNDEEITILSVDVGYKAKNRLANLGLVPGVKIVKKRAAPFKGPIEIYVKGTSLVLGRGLAMKIKIKCNRHCKS